MSKQALKSLQSTLPHWEPDIVFDIGANKGQTAEEILGAYPNTRILCFEPVPATFERLKLSMAAHRRVECHPFALGRESGTALMRAKGTSTGNAIVAPGSGNASNTIAVSLQTGDAFCASSGISRISYLKIDTEGSDLEVLRGFKTMIEERSVDLLQVEASLSPDNRKHVPFAAFRDELEPRGYRLLRIVDQVQERHSFALRRCNAIFISTSLAETKPPRDGSTGDD